jgi:hypothetical protein
VVDRNGIEGWWRDGGGSGLRQVGTVIVGIYRGQNALKGFVMGSA